MRIPAHHDWPLTTEEAVVIQQRLRSKVITVDQLGPVNHVAGVDVGFESSGSVTRAAVAVLSWPELQLQEQAIVAQPSTKPTLGALSKHRSTVDIICPGT
jgi:deoxyribonuclease V